MFKARNVFVNSVSTMFQFKTANLVCLIKEVEQDYQLDFALWINQANQFNVSVKQFFSGQRLITYHVMQ